MKIFPSRVKKWIPVLVGFVAGIGFGIWLFFQNVNTNNCPFYMEPVIWIIDFIRRMIKPQRLDMPAVVLILIIYCGCLGAILGFLVQLFLGAFRKRKRRC